MLHLSRSGGTPDDLRLLDGVLLHLVQLCDARRSAPAPDRLRAEALGDRLHPGEGDLPVRDIVARVPDAVPLALEAPRAEDAARSPVERAVVDGAALRRFLAGAPGEGSAGRI